MALVFQYGSNMSISRLNSKERISGDATLICVARTIDPFDLMFTVLSKSNKCAAADLVPSNAGRSIYGVLYEIPDFLLSRDTARQRSRKSLDEIEGEGTNYIRTMIKLFADDGATIHAVTYVVKDRKANLLTSFAYVSHILYGLQERGMPEEYCQYVRSKIIENNSDLENPLLAFPIDEK